MADNNPADYSNDPQAPRPANGNGATNRGTPSNGSGPYRQPPLQQQLHYTQPEMPAHSGHAPQNASHGMDTSADGLGQILARQWYVVALSAVAVLMLSVLYLLMTKPSYTSITTLRVAPLDASSISSSPAAGVPLEADSDFLETECVTIKSNAVLSLAMDKIRDTRTLKEMSHPMDYVRAKLQADPSKVGRAIDVSFDAHSQADADLIVDSVVQAYEDYEKQTWKSQADDFLNILNEGAKSRESELVQVQQKLHDIAAANNLSSDSDPDKSPQHMAVLTLLEAQGKAKLETLTAHTAYIQASKAMVGNPELLQAVDDAEQRATASTNPEDQLKRYQDELAVLQAQLADHLRTFGPNHPMVLAEQARVNAMTVDTIVAAKEWEESATAAQDAIGKSLTDAEKTEADVADAQREYIQLRADQVRLKQLSNENDKRAHQVLLNKSTGALTISVLNQDVEGDIKPAKFRTLAIGTVVGIIFGLGLACVRDWTDDRMRTPQAVRTTVGAPVLGAIPAITTAYTAADRGQIVHHEPFGIASESYRTLRTALQFGLPAGTKTLLVTSPVSGDGKSTFVSNLGIALAQASKKILIVDADFRAPMQHRLFGLKDRVGFASVLSGTDSMEQAIQQTEIDGLDVLPCGPTPSNPSEMLNSPAFVEHLNELADKYDMVLLDSPPVTAVADARILAASADVSLMVIRLDSSTRKQAEAARDGLRSVGARLIGVAINGVSRAGHFGGASGYYQTGGNTLPAGFERPAARPGLDGAESMIDPSSRV